LVIKSVAEWRHEREMKAIRDLPPENVTTALGVASVKTA
jgi:sulfate transport system permease protein